MADCMECFLQSFTLISVFLIDMMLVHFLLTLKVSCTINPAHDNGLCETF